MTTPETITVDLENAKKLKAAGWQYESQWYWVTHYLDLGGSELPAMLVLNQGESHDFHQFYWPEEECTASRTENYYAAPTAEEILRRLPVYFSHGEEKRVIRMVRDKDGRYSVFHESYAIKTSLGELPYYDVPKIQKYDILANAAAAMYCYLAEHSLLPQ